MVNELVGSVRKQVDLCDHARTKWIDYTDKRRHGWIRTVCACGRFMGYRDKRNDKKVEVDV